MDDVNATLVRLADPTARGEILTEDALLDLATVCYPAGSTGLGAPATAVFDRFDVGIPLRPDVVTAASARRADLPVPWEITASWSGLVPPGPGADAVWAGKIVVRAQGGPGIVESVELREPDVDGALAAARAGLPPDAPPEQVQAALRAAAGSELATPPLTDAELDSVLTAMARAPDPVALGHAAGREVVGLRVAMSDVAADGPAPVALPVVVAFVVAGADESPRRLLAATVTARSAAAGYPVRQVPPEAPPRTVERCVCWVVPGAVFDDDGWPGATAGADPTRQRGQRLSAARTWLATQGIAVITT